MAPLKIGEPKQMVSFTTQYTRLIKLAQDLETPTNIKKTNELNELLSQIPKDKVEKQHIPLLDDLITILYNTNNILEEYDEIINELQRYLRGSNI